MSSNRFTQPDLFVHLAQLPQAWQSLLRTPVVEQAFKDLSAMLARRLAAGAVIYPAQPLRVLQGLSPDAIRVVILGQDPYHGAGQAHGLAFSVPAGVPAPPSLRNILNEIDLEFPEDPSRLTPTAGAGQTDLSRWLRQGVLLLNTSLTVEDGQPASHAKQGWETVTDAIITAVAQTPSPKVFLLWGAHAQAKQDLLRPDPSARSAQSQHLILSCNHPSPLSARRGATPFIGCGHFQATNAWLAQRNLQVIDWKA